MKATYEISAETRQQFGKRASRRLRRLENQVIGVLYGANKPALAIKLKHNELSKALQHEGFYSNILTLKLEGAEEKVVLKALHRHPYKPSILHVDFLRINPNEKLTMQVPLHFVNEDAAPGIKEGGQISHLMNEIEVRCLPSNLPEFIEADLSGLVMNQILHMSELKLPNGVELPALLHGQDPAIASLHMPRMNIEPAAETAEATPASSTATDGKKA